MSLIIPAKRRVVVRRVVAMSHCRSAQIESYLYIYKPSDIVATTRRTTTRRLSRFARYKTTRRKGDNDISCVVAIDIATPKVYHISHHINQPKIYKKWCRQQSSLSLWRGLKMKRTNKLSFCYKLNLHIGLSPEQRKRLQTKEVNNLITNEKLRSSHREWRSLKFNSAFLYLVSFWH
jgi:hypothetical protein